MEHFDGRPVWHCSVSPKQKVKLACEVIARVGYGPVFCEDGATAIHLRRHLTDSEMSGVEVKDVRGTPEEAARLAPVRQYLPLGWSESR
jgi:hypothetical protein